MNKVTYSLHVADPESRKPGQLICRTVSRRKLLKAMVLWPDLGRELEKVVVLMSSGDSKTGSELIKWVNDL
ncbi:hypothetical protein [Alcanivorax sp. 1008]|uniref:hypothetical protein n=1 Tax=Alcanivorax sp. 1008 TaxID=2816853 RepID=UPI001DED2BA4|nr:hypothetical protein [Alcanivorax sp. 1008]MCC1496849.1 hypothetical protein [Alcanivorax sp. 1008]